MAAQVLEAVTEDAYAGDYCTLERGGQIRNSTSTSSVVSSSTYRPRPVPTTPRTYPSDDEEEDDQDLRIILVGQDCYENQELVSTAQKLSVSEVLTSEDGLECVQSASERETLFVLTQFEGETYHKLHRAETLIIGPPVILACNRNKQALPYSSRPLFCMSMQKIVVCFTGFKGRDRIGHLVDLVHHMGGSVRRDMTPKVTHLIANCTGGEKYKYAMTMGMPIMSGQWVERLWEERYNLDINAHSESMMEYKVKPFFDCCLSFWGFSAAEQKHMEEISLENGGSSTTVGCADATHLVVDDVSVKELPAGLLLPSLVVRGEWFWGCITMAACAEEKLYLFHQASTGPERSASSTSLRPRSRKRKRLKQLAVEGELSSPYGYKRRSGDNSAISLSPNSFLDASRTPDKSDLNQSVVENTENKPAVAPSKVSKRMHVVMELLHTETNYTAILHTILNTFKDQIEKADQYGGPLLAAQDTKIIFGNIPPIADVHDKMKADLSDLLECWTEDACVGGLVLKHADAFMKAYPNFVNFFESTKETIIKCDLQNPRFHAFLKVCLSKPECGRQTLQELLIRPVQRLPSIILLLGDILKSTPNGHCDKENLGKAIESLKNVLTHINEDKRKTEGQMVMFDIVNDIDNCPATLLSSHRSFISRIDVVELTDTIGRRGDPLSLFLFSDSIEICKRRTKNPATPKTLTPHKAAQKTFKHLEMLPMPSIKRVLDFAETEDCVCAFGLIYRTKEQSNEKLLSFTLDAAEVSKEATLTALCKTIANALCRTDFDTVMAQVCGEEFHVNTKDLVRRTLTSKISKRVSRAFSINRTPGKLKRAVSHVFSPFMRDGPSDLTNSRRLGASTFDLTEENLSGMSHFEDSDCISLGAYSLQEDPHSPMQFMTPKSTKTPKSKGASKWATIGPGSVSKFLK